MRTNGILKEVNLTFEDKILYTIRQKIGGEIEFISGTIDVNALPNNHKESILYSLREMFNPNCKEVKK